MWDFSVKLFLHQFITLVTILNPIAAASIMLPLLPEGDEKAVGVVSRKASLTVFVASIITLFLGEAIFRVFGINVESIKVIGGIIIMLIAVNMVYGEPKKAHHTQEENDEAQTKEDIAVVPLGIPILFGPGVIAVLILFNDRAHTPGEYLTSVVAVVASVVVVYLTLYYAAKIDKLLGVTGMKIMTRIMGLILGAIASQFLIGGIKGLWHLLH